MKKYCFNAFLFLCCLFAFLPSAQAEKNDWAEPSYPFSSIHALMVSPIDLSGGKISNDIVEKNLQTAYQKKSEKLSCTRLTPEQVNRKISLKQFVDLDALAVKEPEKAKQLFQEHAAEYIDAYITAKLLSYEIGSYVVPAHVEWQSREETDTYTDKDGHTQTYRHTISYPVSVPDRTVSTATVTLRFDVYDAKTGKPIYSREETRVRDDSDEPQGVFQRMADSFFHDFDKKIKP